MRQVLITILDVCADLTLGFSVVAAFGGHWDVGTFLLVLGLHFDRQAALMDQNEY